MTVRKRLISQLTPEEEATEAKLLASRRAARLWCTVLSPFDPDRKELQECIRKIDALLDARERERNRWRNAS